MDIRVMDLHLARRVAMITGPAKGMGAAITRAFAAEGASVALVGRDTAAIEPLAGEVKTKGANAIVIKCDLTVPAQCQHAADETKKAYGRIDILVNVAGGSGPIGKSGVETTPEEFDDVSPSVVERRGLRLERGHRRLRDRRRREWHGAPQHDRNSSGGSERNRQRPARGQHGIGVHQPPLDPVPDRRRVQFRQIAQGSTQAPHRRFG